MASTRVTISSVPVDLTRNSLDSAGDKVILITDTIYSVQNVSIFDVLICEQTDSPDADAAWGIIESKKRVNVSITYASQAADVPIWVKTNLASQKSKLIVNRVGTV